MDFDLLFPNVKFNEMAGTSISKKEYNLLPSDNYKYIIGHYLKSETKYKCLICNKETYWVDVANSSILCSEECFEKFWNQYGGLE